MCRPYTVCAGEVCPCSRAVITKPETPEGRETVKVPGLRRGRRDGQGPKVEQGV